MAKRHNTNKQDKQKKHTNARAKKKKKKRVFFKKKPNHPSGMAATDPTTCPYACLVGNGQPNDEKTAKLQITHATIHFLQYPAIF